MKIPILLLFRKFLISSFFFLRHEWFGMLLSLLFSTLMDRSLCMVYGAHAVQVHFDSIVDVKSQKSKSWLQIIMKLNENRNINHANL